ncbi:MAG: hypothetical protein Q8P60_02840 [Pseudorhodobacter sp.]|nr:hypothetical protein [Pseudorhodobacter sp.]
MRPLLPIALVLVLAACQFFLPGKPGGSDAPVPENPIAGEAIAVTSLDAAPESSAESSAEPAPEPTLPAPAAPAVKSAEQIACERKGGSYANVGQSTARTCIRPTRDNGKQCKRESDCEGACLARSQTCAPVTPMLGCNDILQNDGRRVTLCID